MPQPSSYRQSHRGTRWSSRKSSDSPPGLVDSGSASSGGSSMEEVANRKQRLSSDRKVMRGAEILRRQIVEESFQDDEQIMYLHHRASGPRARKGTNKKKTITVFQDDDDSDWSDPMPPPRHPLASLERTERRGAENYISDPSDDEYGVVDGKNIRQTGKRVSWPCEEADVEVTPQNPTLEPRVIEMENLSLFGDSTCSSLFPNCGAFEQGLLQTAAEAWSGKGQEVPEVVEAEEKQQSIPPITSQRASHFLQDLQVSEADLCSPQKNDEFEKYWRQLSPPPQPSHRHKPVSPPTLLSFVAPPRAVTGPDPADHIVAPSSAAYFRLMRDEGHLHALRAGTLWQSIVSQHVRFPFTWWNGSRSPPMGVGNLQLWTFLGRHRVRSNPSLCKLVPSRGDAGRLLLHILVRDIMTGEAILDIAVGVFHPNARGIRTTAAADPSLGSCRDIWLAVRPRVSDETPIETLLWESGQPDQSPLGAKRAIDNGNLRSVFGERPPVVTVFVLESDLYDVLTQPTGQPAAAILLEKYYADW